MLVRQTTDKENEKKKSNSEQEKYEECSYKRHCTHTVPAYELRMEFYIHISPLQSLTITLESMNSEEANLYTLRWLVNFSGRTTPSLEMIDTKNEIKNDKKKSILFILFY